VTSKWQMTVIYSPNDFNDEEEALLAAVVVT
jgi:hypothetical protein